MRFIAYVILTGLAIISLGQKTDSIHFLTLPEVLSLANENHPIIRQANLQSDFAEAELRIAKGQFDPKLISSFNSKEFKGKEYYNKFYSALKVPTWFPIDPKIEVYKNQGDLLNAEKFIPPASDFWQVATGVNISLGKGLFVDERRTMIRQARNFGELAEAERTNLINKMLLNIVKSYWDWYFTYREYELMRQSIDIAENLFERVKLDYNFGEAAVIDTIQAKINYQTRKVDFQKAQLNLTQAKLAFAIHLWGPDNLPLELTENVFPTDSERIGVIPADTSVRYLWEWAVQNHPEILKMEAKQNQLEINQRWYQESLKPEINLSYSLINAPISPEGFQTPQWQENYKIGVDVAFPLFLRKERGQLQKNRLYMESIGYDLVQAQQEIVAGVRSTFAELKTNESLAREYQAIAENYERLLNAELFNLETGESDLFKLNIQQDKYIEAQMKYLNALIKLEKLKATLPYAVGLPNLSYQNLYE